MNMSFLKPNSLRVPIICVVALTFATFSLFAAPIKVGDTFPDLSKFRLEGKLPDLKGKVVLVDFWASWCVPCKKSFPALNELHRRYGGKGLVIIAVNVDENRANMEAFLKSIPASFTVVRDAEQKLVATAEVEGMPTSFLLDTTGRVRFRHNGYAGDETKNKYAGEIEELLKRP
jgi:thiol-disulfide isomerase/thioredoxin